MTKAVSFASALALVGVALTGCATGEYYEPVAASPNTNAPSIDNSDAAGPASVPGWRTGPGGVVVPPPR